MDKKKAHTNAGTKYNINFNDNSSKNQCKKLLVYLIENTTITSNEARAKLDIYHPPARIRDLRKAGHIINTFWVTWSSDYGIHHRIAKYVLVKSNPSEALY